MDAGERLKELLKENPDAEGHLKEMFNDFMSNERKKETLKLAQIKAVLSASSSFVLTDDMAMGDVNPADIPKILKGLKRVEEDLKKQYKEWQAEVDNLMQD